MLSDKQFERTRRLASKLAGIELAERHRELLARRSERLGLRDDGEMDSFLSAVEQGEATARQKFLCLLTTKFTSFFRHPRHFEIAAEHALRVARERSQARLWSAAAATGEEPWSLAMALLEVFQHDNPPVSILATDVDTEALALAQRGEYGGLALQALSPERCGRFLSENRIAPVVRRLVEFRPLNLADVDWPVAGPMDVVFCRNVLMYFEAGHRYAVLERMASLLAPDGLLMLDPAEHLGTAGHWFTPGAGGVYARRHGQLASRRLNSTP